MDRISLIIPLRLTAATFEGELRLRRICEAIPRDIFDILIVDYGTLDAHAGPIRALEADGVAVARHPQPERLFSIGKARDFGVQMARQAVVMFNDVDFLATPSMYRAIHAEVMRRDMARQGFDFLCVPVLFLTEAGTRAWFDAVASGRPFMEPLTVEAAEGAADMIQSVAFGSSAMIVNRQHYLAVGGHDPGFSGHGAEDYDILHRLSTFAPRGPRPHDYYTDYRYNSLHHYWGFRPFFALYGLELFATGLHLVHLWHPRRKEKGYFRPSQNARLLQRLMRRFDHRGDQPAPLTDPASGVRMLAFAGGETDRLLLRPLLAHSAAYVVRKAKALPVPARLRAMADSAAADWVVIGPGVDADMPMLETASALQGLVLLRLEADTARGGYILRIVRPNGAAGPAVSLHIAPEPVLTSAGKLVMLRWPPTQVPGLGEVGAPPPPLPLDTGSAVFECFGPDFAEPLRTMRPQRRKKSPWAVRLWRRMTQS